MKRFICVLMALITASMCIFNTSAAEKVPPAATNLPTMYISGQGTRIRVYNEDGTYSRKIIYPVDYDTDEILDSVSFLHKPFAKGVATGDWDEWCDTFVDIVTPLFESYAMNEDGESKERVFLYYPDFNQCDKNEDGKLGFEQYKYLYDWRSDPITSPDRLQYYVGKLLMSTGYNKVNIIGRCIGGNVLLSYLKRYDLSKLNSVAFYCEGFDGFEIIGKLFTGDINIDADALSRFADDYLSDGQYRDDELYAMITDLISVLNTMQTLGVAVDTFDGIYEKVYANVMPRILRKSFGTMPSFWALVGDKYYEDAKEFVFGDEAETTYAKLVEKIDDFHYNYLLKYEEIIQTAIDSGVKVYIISKYGMQIFPTGGNDYVQSDTLLELPSASAGATCAQTNTKFTDEYLATVNSRYISADKQIDASTCLLPEHTWFIKNITHMYMPDSADRMIADILDGETYISAPDHEAYPQFTIFNKETEEITPLTEENGNPDNHPNFFKRLFSFFKHLFSILSEFINEKIQEMKENKNPTE